MEEKKKTVFLRDATGLIKEVSIFRATFLNMAGSVGNGAAISTAYVALYPIALVFGLPGFSWALTVGAAFSVCYLLCLAVLNHIMPRTGGDYVYTSRILHPLLGFIEGWMFLFSVAAATGYNGWATIYNLGNLSTAGIMFGKAAISLGNTLTTNTNMVIIGIVMFVIAGLILTSSPRAMLRINGILVILGVISVFLLLIPLIGVSPSTFAANFQSYSGTTTSQVIQTALSNGFNPSQSYNPQIIGALLAFALFAYVGFTNSTFMAGELRGNVAKNTAVSTLIGLLFPLFAGAYYILPFFNSAGYTFVNAWGYLFWNDPGAAPLHTAPSTVILASLSNPSLATISLIAGFFVNVVFNFVIIISWVTAATRITFAQSMDRMMPSKLASVNRRSQPVYSIVLWIIVGFFFYLLTIYGRSPVSSLYYLVILGFLALMFPAINVIAIKWRRADLWKAAAPSWAKREFLKIPFIAWLGIIWLLFLLPVFGYVDIWGIFSSLLTTPGTAILSYTFSSGVFLSGVLVVAAIIWYFVNNSYRKKKGIDVGMVFSEIPPE